MVKVAAVNSPDFGSERRRVPTALITIRTHLTIHENARDTVVILKILVSTTLVIDKQSDQVATVHTRGKTTNVDRRVSFVPDKVSPGDGKVTSDHGTP